MTIKTEGISILSPAQNRTYSVQRGRRLQFLTFAWNSAEFVIALVAGFLAGSIALVGFGFDSAIEVASSLAALWRLGHDRDEESRERTEKMLFDLSVYYSSCWPAIFSMNRSMILSAGFIHSTAP